MKKEINNSFENVEKRASKLPSECTTIIVGEEQSADGAKYLCRSSDFDALMAINIEVHEDTKFGSEEFVAKDSKFRCPLPKEALGYTGLPDYQFPGEWGSAGFNTAGVGMSSTETIFSSDKALAFDPYVKNGLAENCTYNIVLPYVHTAREGAARLGKLIEQYGSAEGFGIGFIDDKEIWYLENACGHKWLACRMPKDQYFVTGNQSRFRDYAPEDKENFMAAPDLIEFAEKNGLYDPNDAEAEKDKHGKAKFDFHKAYSRDEELDTTYNYPRVWGLQQMFSPAIQNDVTKNTFPELYTHVANGRCKDDSAYWRIRKVMTLGMTDYKAFAPIIKDAYAKLEAENDQRQKEMETEYLKLYKESPIKAQDLLQYFSDGVLNHAIEVADELVEELFTRLTEKIQKEYLFHGA